MFPVTVTLNNQEELSRVLAALNVPEEDRQLPLTEQPVTTQEQSEKEEKAATKKAASAQKQEKPVIEQPTAMEGTETAAPNEKAQSGEDESQQPEASRDEANDLIRQLARSGGRDKAVSILARFDAKRASDIKDGDISEFCAAVRATLEATGAEA